MTSCPLTCSDKPMPPTRCGSWIHIIRLAVQAGGCTSAHLFCTCWSGLPGIGMKAEGDTVIWFWIGDHDEYDRILR